MLGINFLENLFSFVNSYQKLTKYLNFNLQKVNYAF